MLDAFRFLKLAWRSERRSSKPRRGTPGLSSYHRRLLCEALERRTLLSAGLAAGAVGAGVQAPRRRPAANPGRGARRGTAGRLGSFFAGSQARRSQWRDVRPVRLLGGHERQHAGGGSTGGQRLVGGGLRLHAIRLDLDPSGPTYAPPMPGRVTISASRWPSAAIRWWSERNTSPPYWWMV